MDRILVVGSLNMDFVIEVARMPKPGETLLGSSLSLVPGGKGANQAYAAAKLGAHVSMMGAVGKDAYGKRLLENLASVQVDIGGVAVLEGQPTGSAFITVDGQGENSIIVLQGANKQVGVDYVNQMEGLLDDCGLVVMQLEIPLETVEYVAKLAKKKGKMVILDPAPAPGILPPSLVPNVDILKPNVTELALLSGMATGTMEEIQEAARSLVDQGVKRLVVTLGKGGAVLVDRDRCHHFPGRQVPVVDTTAAGDCFTAAFAFCLAQGGSAVEAIQLGNQVSAVAVTRKGAQASIPTMGQVEAFWRGQANPRR